MESLDETDLDILHLLLDDARRPYSDIADRVDVSAPTVSDRIGRLVDLGVIKEFTVNVDRATFTDGIDVLIDLELRTNGDDRLVDQIAAVEQIEHVISTADTRLFAIGTVRTDRIRDILEEAIDLDQVDSYRVHIIDDHVWNPTIEAPERAADAESEDEKQASDDQPADEEPDALTPTR